MTTTTTTSESEHLMTDEWGKIEPIRKRDRTAYYEARKDDPEIWGGPLPAPKSQRRITASMFSVRLTPQQAEFIRWAARARGMSVSAFLRECALEKAALPVVAVNSNVTVTR